jgi:DNA-binding MarR family transcriptional regulator
MSAHDLNDAAQRRARAQLDTIWQVALDLANKAGVDLPVEAHSDKAGLRRSPGPYGYGEMAATAYKERRLREQFFEIDLFAEPGWDIMLDLFTQNSLQRQVSVTSACIAAAVPATTALRWIGILAERGLVARTADPLDRRRAFIRLTHSGLLKMNQYFEAADKYRTRAVLQGSGA